jgi:hypothetical protein
MQVKLKKISKPKNSKKVGRPNLTKRQMRIAIAKDVIAQLEAKKIVATVGNWIEDPKLGTLDCFVESKLANGINENVVKIDACDYVNKLNKCKVCALGSLFVSSVHLDNDISWKMNKEAQRSFLDMSCRQNDCGFTYCTFENIDNFSSESVLLKYFSRRQLVLIENAFENNKGTLSPFSDYDVTLCKAFYRKYCHNNKNRLIGIMNNIINNDGTFDPKTDLSVDDVLEMV